MEVSDWIALGSLVVAAAALVTGFVALGRSKRANDHAAEANVEARKANTHATEANQIARESNGIAREANSISERTAEQALERNVVDFDWTWEGDGSVTVTNRGEGIALDVNGYLELNDETVNISEPQIGPGGSVALDFPKTFRGVEAKEFEDEHREAEAARIARNSPYPIVTPYTPRLAGTDRSVFRISWRSPAGVPGTYGPVSSKKTLRNRDL